MNVGKLKLKNVGSVGSATELNSSLTPKVISRVHDWYGRIRSSQKAMNYAFLLFTFTFTFTFTLTFATRSRAGINDTV